MKSIGERIKEYRLKNNMTQEQLASYLYVTYQTVSKWETGVSSPDLSLIVTITRIFHITADELLGVNDVQDDKRYVELKKAYDQTFKTEDFAERQRICELAVAEYPGDMNWLRNLAWVISNRSFEYADNEKYAAEQEKAIKLFDSVIKNCKDDVIRGSAITGITQLLCWRGRKDEARRYVEMIPERSMITREAVLEYTLEGEELAIFKQKRIMSHMEGIIWDLSLARDLRSDLIRKIIDTMLPDGNYLRFNLDLYQAAEKELNHILNNGQENSKDKIVSLLKEMRAYAEAYDRIVFKKPGVYKYTAPWFDRIEEDTRLWIGNEGTHMIDEYRKLVSKEKFDNIRDML
ncbi:MAG: helix-turn-helix transcriptional regulator [Clostridia bacterium]|nr:helix-turn-helix transcriptional regulator [Clostridia bacterium]